MPVGALLVLQGGDIFCLRIGHAGMVAASDDDRESLGARTSDSLTIGPNPVKFVQESVQIR